MSDRGDDHTRQRLPRRLGRYVLLSRLTGGGMTEVYAAKLAEEVGPGRLLVIKLLPQSLKDDPEAESRFLEESRILLNLTHGNITAAFEFGRSENDRPFLVMEYVPGPSLRRLMDAVQKKNTPLGIPDALFITAEVSKALGYAHSFSNPLSDSQGIVHRDISPDNIIISTTGQVKLTDFGIAQFVQERSYGPVFGKAPYVAPEVAEGASPTAASDLYSLGAVLYECLTGQPPLKGKTDNETLTLAKSVPPRSPVEMREDVPTELGALVDALLEKAPSKRPVSASEVQVRVRTILNARFASFTEPELAKTVLSQFSREDFLAPSATHKLRADLASAGIDIGNEVTTDDLLEEGTVRIADAKPAPPNAAARDGAKQSYRNVVIGAVLLALSVASGLWFAFSNRAEKTDPKPPQPKVENVEPERAPNPIPQTPSPEEAPQAVTPSPSPPEPSPVPPPATPKVRHLSKRPANGAGTKRPPASTDTGKASPAPSTDFGWLNINSYPWSYVTVDGKKLSGHTPYRRVKLKSGPHELVFENPELKLKTSKTVDVTAFEETNVGVRLK